MSHICIMDEDEDAGIILKSKSSEMYKKEKMHSLQVDEVFSGYFLV